MKTKEIIRTYGVDGAAFERWLKQSRYAYRTAMMGGLELTDGQNVDEVVLAFKQSQVEEKERTAREASERDRAEALKQQAVDQMWVTTGFNFESYRIARYAGYVSGDAGTQFARTSGLFGRSTGVGPGLMASMSALRQSALTQLKEEAYEQGCNAVIGLAFDYLTVDPKSSGAGGGSVSYHPYVFGVTANGTAVVVEQLGFPTR